MQSGRRGVVAVLALVLLTSACGSRLPQDVLASLDGQATSDRQAVSEQPTSQGPVSTAAPTTTGEGTPTTGGETTGGGGETTGGGESEQPAAVDQASRCADATPAAPGVTDDEITVASIVTDSGPLPGATEGAYRGAASYFNMVNATGGVCGRQIRILKGDDGLDPRKARGEFQRLEPSVYAFAGSFSVADSGYTDLIESTGVPYVSLSVEPAGRAFRNVFPKTADGIVNTGPFVWWRQEHPDADRAAVLYADVGGVGANVGGFQAGLERAGFDVQYASSASAVSPDYTPEVRQAQDANVEFFYLFAFEVNMHVRIIRNMRQQNYDPPIKGSNIGFNTRFSDLLGTDGDGWENHNTHLLFLDPAERGRSEALARFQDWNERSFPGAQLDLFPVSGWGRAALFVDALQRIEGEFTREALVDALYTIETFDGGGMEVPVDPRTGLGDGCWNMAEHSDGTWVRSYPTDKLYECDIGELYRYE